MEVRRWSAAPVERVMASGVMRRAVFRGRGNAADFFAPEVRQLTLTFSSAASKAVSAACSSAGSHSVHTKTRPWLDRTATTSIVAPTPPV